jgi:hypothetical protein
MPQVNLPVSAWAPVLAAMHTHTYTHASSILIWGCRSRGSRLRCCHETRVLCASFLLCLQVFECCLPHWNLDPVA